MRALPSEEAQMSSTEKTAPCPGEGQDRHPKWCQRDICEMDALGGAHLGPAVVLQATGDDVRLITHRALYDSEGPALPEIETVVLEMHMTAFEDWSTKAYLNRADVLALVRDLLAALDGAAS